MSKNDQNFDRFQEGDCALRAAIRPADTLQAGPDAYTHEAPSDACCASEGAGHVRTQFYSGDPG